VWASSVAADASNGKMERVSKVTDARLLFIFRQHNQDSRRRGDGFFDYFAGALSRLRSGVRKM
jgi:hypothetical protein